MKVRTKEKTSVKKLVYIGILVALSYLGSLFTLEGSIALDSMPGFFAAVYIDPMAGALVAGIGHLISAINSGFPRTIIMHIWLIISMGLTAYIFGYSYRRINRILSIVVTTIINGPVILVVSSTLAKTLGLAPNAKAFFLMLLAPLTIASAVNIILAAVLYELINTRFPYRD